MSYDSDEEYSENSLPNNTKIDYVSQITNNILYLFFFLIDWKIMVMKKILYPG